MGRHGEEKRSSKHKHSRDKLDHEHKSKRKHRSDKDESSKRRRHSKDEDNVRIADDDPDDDMWVEKNIDMDGENVSICIRYFLDIWRENEQSTACHNHNTNF